jgi:hypothetical protein
MMSAGEKPAVASELKTALAYRLPTLVSVMMAQRSASLRRAHSRPNRSIKPGAILMS